MAETKIEWADVVWNPVIGCSPISEGCKRCYARAFAQRLAGQGVEGYSDVKAWDGTTRLIENKIDQPLRWRKARRIFVCSMSDLFHPSIPNEWRWRVFRVAAAAPQHTFLMLTKRPAIAAMLPWWEERPNVWLGVSVEAPRHLGRVETLFGIPAAKRFISMEPLLAKVRPWLKRGHCREHGAGPPADGRDRMIDGRAAVYCKVCGWAYETAGHIDRIDWVIAGPETGAGARSAEPDWFRRVRDQCAAAGVPFFYKGGELDGRKHEELP